VRPDAPERARSPHTTAPPAPSLDGFVCVVNTRSRGNRVCLIKFY
jgi:hypothetical protein